jgi:hypothetical protein
MGCRVKLAPAPDHGPASVHGLGHSILASELINATAGVNDLLLARVKRVTRRAHFDKEIVAEGRTGFKFIAATTGDLNGVVIGVSIGFHGGSLRKVLLRKKGRVGYSEAPTAASPDFYPQNLWIRLWRKIE